MPLPLIPVLLGGAALLGGGMVASSISDNNEAEEIDIDADFLVDYARNVLQWSREAAGEALNILGYRKVYILEHEIKDFIDIFGQLKDVEFTGSAGINEVQYLRLEQHDFKGLRDMSDLASSVSEGILSGTVTGALTALGAYSGAMAFGTASTCTAIATLSGAAASNATLAFLGGGSLAAGGLGVAGGAMVLGGLVAAPALAVLGLFMGSSASKNLSRARSNMAKAKRFYREAKAGAEACNAVRRCAYMFERLLIRLDGLLYNANDAMRRAISNHGTDYTTFTPDEKKAVGAAASLAKAVKTILDTPILTEDGKLTPESLDAANSVRAALPA